MAAPDVSSREDSPAPEAVRPQLEKILESSDFSGAARGSAFLRFLVEETLAGRQDRLKEYTLAVEVFDRGESFDPGTNPAVRVEAGRLRKRLEHYYLTQGREDPVLIELPRGSYVPRFRSNPDILHLHEMLEETRNSVGDDATLAPIPSGPSIAVLPFACLNGEESRVFSDGITVEIITALSRFREFRVLGRHTTFNRRNGEPPLTAARALGVRYVLSGSVRRTDDKVRVNAELTSGQDGSVLWSESYERDLCVEMIFDIQDDIANHVVVTVAQPYGVIVRPELVLARRKPLSCLDSYECVLLYYSYNADLSEEGHARALEALEAAHERDPDATMVLSALSHLYVDSFSFGYNLTGDRHAMLQRGLQMAQRAVQLDPLDPLSYRALFVARFAAGDLKGFREAADRAVTLNPNNTDILADYGLHLVMSNDWERGRLFLKVALSLNPEPPDWYWMPFVSWYFWNGDYEAALDYALKIQGTGFYWTHCLQAMAYVGVGAMDEARASIARLLEIKPDFARNAHAELARWVDETRIHRALEVLQQAGLEVPG
jgi:TolB-like protein